MILSFKIARRYLFAKKSTNAINIISGISVFGIAVGVAALVLVLSVFNGFEDLLSGMFSSFNPDIKVEIKQGKTFPLDAAKIKALEALPEVSIVSQTLEETALFDYKDVQVFGTLKGVDEQFHLVTGIDSTVREGLYRFQDGRKDLVVMGLGMRNKLSVNIDDALSTLNVYMPKRKKSSFASQPFQKQLAFPVGTFMIQQDFDGQYVLSSLGFAQKLLAYKDKISALEIKLVPEAVTATAVEKVTAIMGDDFYVKDRYQQNEAFLKLMNMEKWMSFAIMSLMLVLIAFNMIGALWMIVLEKEKDIAILKSMGGTNTFVRNIFLTEGVLLCIVGIIIGFVLAIGFYLIQHSYGIIPIPEGFIVNAYPMSMRVSDFLIVMATVFVIGLVASYPPAIRAMRVSTLIREA